MDYVNLGATGLRVSRVCLGMMIAGTEEVRHTIEQHWPELDARAVPRAT